MPVETKTITVSSKADLDIIDITAMVQDEIQKSHIQNGIVTIFVPGSTASISTIEFEPNLVKDVKKAIERMVPSTIEYEHHKTWGMTMENPMSGQRSWGQESPCHSLITSYCWVHGSRLWY